MMKCGKTYKNGLIDSVESVYYRTGLNAKCASSLFSSYKLYIWKKHVFMFPLVTIRRGLQLSC